MTVFGGVNGSPATSEARAGCRLRDFAMLRAMPKPLPGFALFCGFVAIIPACGGSALTEGGRSDAGAGGAATGSGGRPGAGGASATAGSNAVGGSAGGAPSVAGAPAAGASAAGAPGDACSAPMASGNCNGYEPSFWHNPKSGLCEPFIYGGCGGNENRYPTRG